MSQKGENEKPFGLASLSVEPLSELGWQRVERRLFADGAIPVAEPERAVAGAGARTGRRRLLAGLAGAVATVAVAVLTPILWGPGETDREAEIGAGGGAADRREPAMRAPSRIVTADSPSAVSVGDIALEVGPLSALLIDNDRKGAVLVVLERGELSCRVAPRAGRPPFVVHAGNARIEVIGTVFAVARIGDSARVVVHEGVVEVAQRGQVIRVKAGHTWSGAGEDASIGPAPLAPAQEPRDGAVDRARSSHPGDRGTGRHPLSRLEGAGGRVAGDRGRPGDEAGPAGTQHSADAASAPAAAARDKSRYEQAARLEASNPRAALAIYDELAGSPSLWAANALYAQARLEFELGQRDRARELLDSYIARYPDGANAEDARQLLGQLP